jgi:2-phosphosulfolactate phosphatase
MSQEKVSAMRIDVVFTPAELEKRDLKGWAVVVIDALRATSTIIEAFENGCQAFIPVRTVEEAKQMVADCGQPDFCLGGERGGRMVEGFQFGNSPRDYPAEKVGGKTVVMTTTNGTQALVAARGAAKVFIGAFSNRSALARRLMEEEKDVLIACAGEKDRFCLEDTLCAGAIIDGLEKAGAVLSLSDAALAAKVLYRSSEDSLCQKLLDCEWGRYLESIGLRPDVEICARMDVSSIVPVYKEGRIFLDR